MKHLTTALILTFCSAALLAQSDAQKSFTDLKSLAGTWAGTIRTNPPHKDVEGRTATVTMRVTSMGNALMHEATIPTRPDDPLTVFYLDGDRLMLTHYCDAGNRPRMTATVSPDGRTLDFDFLDIAGSTKYGHMQHATFTFVDADHHIEDWTYLEPGDKPVHARFDLTRTK
ncbi:MAG TPA: hypothetical protein VL284_09520 [Thermoanaerobaculia bacterium]|nr:hypothetical protein [Thermoanaerobaculia bacterium]